MKSQFPITHDNGKIDCRYEITSEFCGYETPRYVLRYCGEFIGQSPKQMGMVTKARQHQKTIKELNK